LRQGPKLILPLRVGALLSVSPSIPVRVSAAADRLEIRGPFGDLTVPYTVVTRVARDRNGEIRLELLGATVRLDCSRVPPMAIDALFDLLEGKGRAAQS
jgi:hypothetical protein